MGYENKIVDWLIDWLIKDIYKHVFFFIYVELHLFGVFEGQFR